MLLLLFQLLALLVFLIIIGEPLRAVFFRRLSFFGNLDFLQVCILDVFIGGFILYLVAILPLGLFSWIGVVCLTAITAVLPVIIHARTIVKGARFSRLKTYAVENKKALLAYSAVFLMFIIFLIINLSSLTGLVLGSVRDESIHALEVQVILENHHIPVTMQPYLSEGIIYPQASHVIFAYASILLGMGAATSVFYVTILFKALSVLGAYFLGRKLGGCLAYGLGLSFVFAVISNWPLNVTWGANPFLVGFPLFLVCLGLLFSFYRFNAKSSVVELLTVGLLFGYAGTIVLTYIQVLLVVAVLILLYYLVRQRSRLTRKIGESVVVFAASLLPLSPFIYRFAVFYQYPGHNVGIAQDFTSWAGQQQRYFSQALQWAFDNLSSYLLLDVSIVLILVCFTILLLKTRAFRTYQPIIGLALGIFGATTFLSFLSFLLPPDFSIVSWGHQGILLSISFSLLIGAALVKFAELRNGKIRWLSKVFSNPSGAAWLLAIIVLALAVSPFLYYRLAQDPKLIRGGYNVYAVTTQSDYALMTWMKTNLPPDAVILVHPFSSGLFIPSVSNHKIIFPYSGSTLSRSYQTLVSLLQNSTLGEEAYQIMRYWNISYVFVGSNVAYTTTNPPRWVPELFLGNPSFKLVKSVGSSYLFKVEERGSAVVFVDDFEYANWDQNRWKNYTWEKGLGNVTISDNGGSKQLAIAAQALPKPGQWELQYSYRVERDIFVPSNDSEVTLSFYVNATQGFEDKDTFAIVIANVQHSQAMFIATPNGVYQNGSFVTVLDSPEGTFSYDLSKMWQTAFNSSLPQRFVLQLVNYDFDGIQNVAYVDNITVTSKLAGTP
ncbi:hypothetical protein G4O51_00935 [Candidatus Bathyarchaeota archaeon A05DMB-2]|nr:hypothetical protein [Candidatus Bathyarchaeota archaeon A05DMB-2]